VSAGAGAQGSVCTTTSECAVGLTCIRGTCRPFCPSAGKACTGTNLGVCEQLSSSSGPIPNLKVCAFACDPRNPSAVCGKNNCIWDPAAKTTDCDVVGTKSESQSCTSTTDCKQGLECVKIPGQGTTCMKWCRLGYNDCSGFKDCVDEIGSGGPKSGGVKLGFCTD
jgi:hypothetical protein